MENKVVVPPGLVSEYLKILDNQYLAEKTAPTIEKWLPNGKTIYLESIELIAGYALYDYHEYIKKSGNEMMLRVTLTGQDDDYNEICKALRKCLTKSGNVKDRESNDDNKKLGDQDDKTSKDNDNKNPEDQCSKTLDSQSDKKDETTKTSLDNEHTKTSDNTSS